MKARENELHEPIVEEYDTGFGYVVNAECSVCGKCLGRKCSIISRENARISLKRELMDYCPNCGARLKEIER